MTDRELVRQRWGALIVVVTWAWVVVPRLAQSVTGSKVAAHVGEEAPPTTAAAHLALLGLTGLLVVVCALAVVTTLGDPHPGRVLALCLLLVPWVYLAMRDVYAGHHPTKAALMYPVVVLALWMVHPRTGVLRVLGVLVGLSAVLCIALGVLVPSAGLFHASTGGVAVEDKAILSSGILVGFLSQGNNLGQFLALGLPLVAMVRHPPTRWALLGCSVFALVWSASRSSIATVVVAVLALGVVAVVRPDARRWVGPLLVAVPAALVCVLPLVTTEPTAFTNRGRIWAWSLDHWRTSPVLGLGSDWYQRVGGTTDRLADSVFHGHNQVVQLLTTGGVVLLVLVAVQVAAAAFRAGRLADGGTVLGVVYLVSLAGTCVLEKSIVIVDNTNMFAVVVVPLTVLLCGDRERGERSRPASGHDEDRLSPDAAWGKAELPDDVPGELPGEGSGEVPGRRYPTTV